MRLKYKVAMLSAMIAGAGCSSYSSKPTTTILPSSQRSIDIVLHRGDVRLMDCATLAVLQTYDLNGQLIDSKEARGTALHCTVLPALIDAGGRVGGAAITRPARTTISNAISAGASAVSNASSSASSSATGGAASATGGIGGAGGAGGSSSGTTSGSGGGSGNNGNGNGNGDGTNPGTDHHHDNGDNN